ncbi:MAG: hypothetical protein KGL39_59570 [Patescibacteria group bacterium]|nr:hypothetical protein [Patescibacteria group bacterium]
MKIYLKRADLHALAEAISVACLKTRDSDGLALPTYAREDCLVEIAKSAVEEATNRRVEILA